MNCVRDTKKYRPKPLMIIFKAKVRMMILDAENLELLVACLLVACHIPGKVLRKVTRPHYHKTAVVI